MAEAMNLELKIASCDKQRRNFYYQLTEKEKACDDWAKKVELGDAKAKFSIDQYCKK